MVTSLPDAGDISFPGKDQGEEFVTFFRQHWIRLFPDCFRLFVYSVLIGVMAWLSFWVYPVDKGTQHVLAVFVVLAFVIVHMNFLMHFYRYFLRCTIFTNRKVHRIKKTLFMTDDHQSTDLWVIQDIDRKQRGPLQNIFKFGSLIIEAQDTQLRLHFVPRVQEKYELLLQLRERAREHMTWGKGPDELREMAQESLA